MQTDDGRFRGIQGLTGREAIGAALAIGIKDARGYPVEKDRFHIVQASADADDRRPHHPMFAVYNNATPDKRRSIKAVLVHASADEAFTYSLRAQKWPGANPPHKMPFCSGDGVTARRFRGMDPDGVADFAEIPCPNERCEFRQQTGKQPIPCKPWMKFLFRPVWPDKLGWPAPLMKFTSGSWRTVENFKGLFDGIARQAAAFGLAPGQYRTLGIDLTMTVVERKTEKGRFPVVEVSADYDPAEFFLRQLRQYQEIQSLAPPAPTPLCLPRVMDETPADDDDDFAAHAPGVHTEPGR